MDRCSAESHYKKRERLEVFLNEPEVRESRKRGEKKSLSKYTGNPCYRGDYGMGRK